VPAGLNHARMQSRDFFAGITPLQKAEADSYRPPLFIGVGALVSSTTRFRQYARTPGVSRTDADTKLKKWFLLLFLQMLLSCIR